MNKPTYFLINSDSVVGTVYESDKYGRTLVILGELKPDCPLEIYEFGSAKKILDADLLEFLSGMIPNN